MFYNQAQASGVIHEVMSSIFEYILQAELSFDTMTDEDIDECLCLLFAGAHEGDRQCIKLVEVLHRHFKYETSDLDINNPYTGIRNRKTYTSPNKHVECPVIGIKLYGRCSHQECSFWDKHKPYNCRASERLSSEDISKITDTPEAVVNRAGDEGIRKVKQRFLEVFIQNEVNQEFVFLPVTNHCVLCASCLDGQRTFYVENKPVCRSCTVHLGIAAELEIKYCIRASQILQEIAKRFSNARNVMDAIGISTSTVDRLYSRYGLNKRQLFTQNTSSGVRSTTARRPGRRIKLRAFLARLTRIELDMSNDGRTIEDDTRAIVADLYSDAARILPLPIPPDLLTPEIEN